MTQEELARRLEGFDMASVTAKMVDGDLGIKFPEGFSEFAHEHCLKITIRHKMTMWNKARKLFKLKSIVDMTILITLPEAGATESVVCICPVH